MRLPWGLSPGGFVAPFMSCDSHGVQLRPPADQVLEKWATLCFGEVEQELLELLRCLSYIPWQSGAEEGSVDGSLAGQLLVLILTCLASLSRLT